MEGVELVGTGDTEHMHGPVPELEGVGVAAGTRSPRVGVGNVVGSELGHSPTQGEGEEAVRQCHQVVQPRAPRAP